MASWHYLALCPTTQISLNGPKYDQVVYIISKSARLMGLRLAPVLEMAISSPFCSTKCPPLCSPGSSASSAPSRPGWSRKSSAAPQPDPRPAARWRRPRRGPWPQHRDPWNSAAPHLRRRHWRDVEPDHWTSLKPPERKKKKTQGIYKWEVLYQLSSTKIRL